jgi:hypothetical protein
VESVFTKNDVELSSGIAARELCRTAAEYKPASQQVIATAFADRAAHLQIMLANEPWQTDDRITFCG